MAVSYDKQFTQWVMHYSGAKEKYPEPWRSAPDTVFTTSRTVVKAAAPGSTTATRDRVPLGTVWAVNALRSGELTIMTDSTKVYVEYKSHGATAAPSERRVAMYDWSKNCVAGCTLPSGDLSGSVLPINFSVDKAGSGTPFFLAIALGLGLRFASDGSVDDESFQIPLELTRLSQVETMEQLDGDNGVRFANLSSLMYAYLNANPVLGVDSSFSIIRLSEGELAEAGERAIPYSDAVQDILKSAKKFPDSVKRAVGAFGVPASMLECKSTTYPSSFFTGESTYTGGADEEEASAGTDFDALRKELKLDIHPLTRDEQAKVPSLNPGYVVDKQLLEAARTIKADWKFPGLDLAPNIILEGDAGSGKTAATSFWANMFGIPRVKMTMNPMMESANLIGAFYPVFSDIDDWSLSDIDRDCLKKVQAYMEKAEILPETGCPKTTDVIKALRRAFSSDEVRDIIRGCYGIPASDEVEFDPEGSWAQLGKEGPAPMESEISLEANRAFETKSFRLMSILCEKAESGQVSYHFILSELMQAFQHGWLVEIQEAASVLRPGVLTELNSLLEPNGTIELPNGSQIRRHPDTIVVITTNRDYAGNMDLNESLRDRCMFGLKMDLPPAAVMAERAMAQTGFTNRSIAIDAAKTIIAVANEAKTSNIKGSFGMRSLLAWMLDLKRGDMSEEAFMRRVIWKMTTRDDDVAILKAVYEAECPFKSAVRTGRRARA